MSSVLRSALLGLVFCSSAVLAPVVCAAGQPEAPYEEFVKKLFARVNEGDFKAVYKDMSSSRLRSGADFADFEAALARAGSLLGKVKDYRPEYVFRDNEYQGFAFVRLQYRVQRENGESVDRLVLMEERGAWVLDGYASYGRGQFLIALGNLYKFDELDNRLAGEGSPEARDLATLRESQAYRDAFDLKASGAQRKQKYEMAIRLAADGNFEEADRLMKEVEMLRDMPVDNPDTAVFKGVKAGRITPDQARMYFRAEQARVIDQDAKKAIAVLEEGLAADRSFASGLIYLAVLYLEEKQPDRAREMIDRVLALEPENIFARYALAQYYAVTGDRERAQKEREAVFSQAANFGPLATVYIGQGFERKYYSDGKLDYECVFVNGIPNGPYKAYFPDGKIREEGRYKDGKLDGECKVYYRDGKVGMEFRYDAGKLTALKQYSSSGELLAEHDL